MKTGVGVKKIILFLCVCILNSLWCSASQVWKKIRTGDFSVYVQKGDYGFQVKMGMEKEISL